MEKSLYLNSFRVCASCARSLVRSSRHTTHRTMGRWIDKTVSWQPYCNAILKSWAGPGCVCLYSTWPTTAQYTTLQTLIHSTWYLDGGFRTLQWNLQCLLGKTYRYRSLSWIPSNTTTLIGSFILALSQSALKYATKKDFERRLRKGYERIRTRNYLFNNVSDDVTETPKLGHGCEGPYWLSEQEPDTVIIQREKLVDCITADRVVVSVPFGSSDTNKTGPCSDQEVYTARQWNCTKVLGRARGGSSWGQSIWCSTCYWRALLLCTLVGEVVEPGPRRHP